MDSPTSTTELVVELEHINEQENQNQSTQISETIVSGGPNVTSASDSLSIPPPNHHSSPNRDRINRRRRAHHPNRHRRRHHRHGRRRGGIRYEKTLLHFSAAHILLGIFCVLVQVILIARSSHNEFSYLFNNTFSF